MEIPESAKGLVALALKAGDPYCAAAVHDVAVGEDKHRLEEIMFSKRRDALALARWEHTPPSVLESLSNTSDHALVVRLDKNQNTPVQAVSQLYVDKNMNSSNLTVLIAQHRHASLSVLKSIARLANDEESLLAVSKNGAANNEVLRMLLRRFKSNPMLAVLQKNISENPSSSAGLLMQLYEKGDVFVKTAVIGHANCPQQLINKAAFENNVLILRKLAADKRLMSSAITRLGVHQDKSVRCAVAANPSTPKATIKLLTNDDATAVRRAVVTRSDLTQSSIVRSLNHHDIWVRQKLARNPVVSNSALDQLSKDQHADVRRSVARNPRCPIRLLRLLAKDKDYWVRSAVAYQHRTPRQLLVTLAEDLAVDVLSGVANNRNTPQRILKKLATSEEADVRRGVILNHSATRLTLLPLLEDDYYFHRLMLVAHPQLKDEDKWRLCLDPDFQVRFVVFRYFAKRFLKSSH